MPSIHLTFDNNYGIYIFAFLILPLIFFYKAKVVNFTTNNLSLSKNTSTQLQGIFILIVVLHHISQRMEPSGFLAIFHYVGYLSVGAFFFISGFGLTKSLQKNSKYLDGFLYQKIARIYLPFIIVNILTLMALYIIGTTFTYDVLIQNIIGVKLIDGTLWFIITILIFYFFFYLSFKKYYGFKSLILVTILVLIYILVYRYLEKGAWTFVSSLCFPLGIYYAFFEKKVNTIIYNNFTPILFGSLFLFLTTFLLYNLHILKGGAFISGIFFVIFIFIIFLRVNPYTLIFNLIGKVSLEIYLLHMKILILFSFFTNLDSGFWITLYFTTLVACAFIFHRFNNFIFIQLTSTTKN